jgi:hypothetical protein
MHTFRLTMGLLIVLASANVAAAGETQQGDKSYLPPESLRAVPGSPTAQALSEPRSSREEVQMRGEGTVSGAPIAGGAWPARDFSSVSSS